MNAQRQLISPSICITNHQHPTHLISDICFTANLTWFFWKEAYWRFRNTFQHSSVASILAHTRTETAAELMGSIRRHQQNLLWWVHVAAHPWEAVLHTGPCTEVWEAAALSWCARAGGGDEGLEKGLFPV